MDDDIQSKMDFIVNQQAQFAANIQLHEERLTRLGNIVTRLADVTLEGRSQITRLTDLHIKLEERMGESYRKTEEAHRRLAEKLDRLAESQAHSDRRLDALIDIIRREREGPNGKS